MPRSSPLLSIDDALSAIGEGLRALPVTRVPLSDALGLTLAEPVRSDIDYPPFDRAMMDGFAVRAADGAHPPTTLEVVGQVAAGEMPTRRVEAGQTVRINTGAPMPAGADAIVVIEHATLDDSGRRMTTSDRPDPGRHVEARGRIVRAGETVLEPGVRIGPGQIAAAATMGSAEVGVHRRPRLAVLVTGDELVSIAERPTGGQIRNSNGPCLTALAREAGCAVEDLGVVGDDREALAAAVERGLTADVLVVSGGVSMGQHDYVPEIVANAGVNVRVHGIAIKPGRPTLFGVGLGGQAVFGLPGNPASCFVCFHVFVRAALDAFQGRPVRPPAMIAAVLDRDMPRVADRAEFIPAVLTGTRAGSVRAAPTAWRGSGDPIGLGRANGLIVRDIGAPPAEAGAAVNVIPLNR